MQCQAKNKQTGEQCRRNAVTGKRVCYVHGGATPSGIANPSYKTGRYSKALPARLMERYDAARTDPDLLALREEVSLTDARLADILGRVDTGESGRRWRQVQKAYTDFRAATEREDVVAALLTLENTIKAGVADYAAWDEIATLLDQRRRLVESEQKRLTAAQQTITAEKAMVLVSALLDSVRRNVSDRAQLAAIQTDFIRLTTHEEHIIDG